MGVTGDGTAPQAAPPAPCWWQQLTFSLEIGSLLCSSPAWVVFMWNSSSKHTPCPGHTRVDGSCRNCRSSDLPDGLYSFFLFFKSAKCIDEAQQTGFQAILDPSPSLGPAFSFLSFRLALTGMPRSGCFAILGACWVPWMSQWACRNGERGPT